MGLQVAQGGGGRGEGAVGGAVHGAEAAPGGAPARPHVRARVAGEVGLVDGDGGDAEAGGGRHPAHAEDERPGEVDEVGAVRGDGRGDPAAGQGDPYLRIAGQGQGGHPDDGAGGVGVRGRVGDGGGDDERGVAPPDEVARGLQGAVRHTVDVGREGFGDDDDTHTGVVVAPGVSPSKSIWTGRERPVSVSRAGPVEGRAAPPARPAPGRS